MLVGTSSGSISVYKWDWWGDSKDRIIGHAEGVESMVSLTDKCVISGSEDGWVRIVATYPHQVSLFKRHADDLEETQPITKIALSYDSNILASISHDCSINFYDMSEVTEQLEDVENGEKMELEEDKQYEPLKAELSLKSKNKEKSEAKVNQKKKNLDFFKEI